MTDKTIPDIWGLCQIINDAHNPRWWQIIIRFRKWRFKCRQLIFKKQCIKNIMSKDKCSRAEAIQIYDVMNSEFNLRVDTILEELDKRILGVNYD